MPPTTSPSFAVKLGLKTKPTKPLCHYTSQNGLIGILKSKAMYATDAAYLNDSQEVIYAINLAKEYFKNHHTKDPRFITEVAKILEKADGHAGSLPVYVASFSEEPDLLSQWRGYCPNGPGFALSLSADRMMTLAQTHDWEIFKCIYDKDEQVDVLKRMLDEASNQTRVPSLRTSLYWPPRPVVTVGIPFRPGRPGAGRAREPPEHHGGSDGGGNALFAGHGRFASTI